MTIFGIGPVELLIIAVIALVFVGPERLPEMLYQLGQGVNKAKRMITDLRNQARQELGDDYESFEDMTRQIRDLNPRRHIQELGRSLLEDSPPVTRIELPPVAVAPPTPKADIAALARTTLAADLLDLPLEDSLSDDSALISPLQREKPEEHQANV
ncbi:MAG TPA: Sec-independent protein translocase protein TatB [Herpetosiphonaceae bacterium]|nr:Sec-independent protein translocase protein TatB [Herpetosiphonaceae bacterium]